MKMEMIKNQLRQNMPLYLILKDIKGVLGVAKVGLNNIEELKSVVFLNFNLDLETLNSEPTFSHSDIVNIPDEKPFKLKLNFGGLVKIFDPFAFSVTDSELTFTLDFPLLEKRVLYLEAKRQNDIANRVVNCSDTFVLIKENHTCPEDEKNEKGFKREIIELGAIMVDKNFNIVKSFNSFITPVINPVLTERCKKSTKLTDEHLSEARTFDVVYKDFLNFLGTDKAKYTYFMWDSGSLVQLRRSVYFATSEDCKYVHYYDNFYSIQELCSANKLPRGEQFSFNRVLEAETPGVTVSTSTEYLESMLRLLQKYFAEWGFKI